MPGKFCPKCGKEDVDFYKGLCFECYQEEHEFIEVPKEIEVTRCSECGYWRYKGDWKKPKPRLLEKIVKDKVDVDLEHVDYKVKNLEDKIKLEVKGDIDREGLMNVDKEYKINLEFNDQPCPVCLKRKNEDFDVKIQLRKNEENHDEDKYNQIHSYIDRMSSQEMDRDNRALSFWKSKKKVGMNFYYGYREVGKRILDKVNSKFNPSVKESTTRAGYDREGKKKVRYTYCIRV